MPRYADLIKALHLEILDFEYLNSILSEFKDHVFMIENRIPCVVIGNGEKNIIILTGFSLYEHRIVNSLILILYNQIIDSKYLSITLPKKLLENYKIHVIPIINIDAYHISKIESKEIELSILDDNNIIVFQDFLTLRSKYSKIVHNYVSNVKPEILYVIYSSKTIEEQISKIKISIHKKFIDLIDYIIKKLKEYDLDVDYEIFEILNLQLPHVHFTFEGIPSIGIIVPYSFSVRKCTTTLITLLSELTELIHAFVRKIETKKKYVVKQKCVIECRAIELQDLINILKNHGISIESIEEDKVNVIYEIDNLLNEYLLGKRLIEYYVKGTKVLECTTTP